MNLDRIVMTGVGLTSPLGNDLGTYRKALLDGQSGVRAFPVRNMGELPAGVCAVAEEGEDGMVDVGGDEDVDLGTPVTVAARRAADWSEGARLKYEAWTKVSYFTRDGESREKFDFAHVERPLRDYWTDVGGYYYRFMSRQQRFTHRQPTGSAPPSGT